MNEYRIEAAKLLLINEKKMSMDLIAEQCGFNSQSTFYNAFKKLVGATPALFRKENKPIRSPEL